MNSHPTGSNAVEVKNLTRRFGDKKALDDVSLAVPSGCVFGVVGENGAGKTTLLRHFLGNLRAESGSVRVLGMNPVQNLKEVLSQIGYLSASPDLPGWMRVKQLLAYTSAFYPSWDESYVRELVEMFDIDVRKKVKQLSTGQNARVGLLLALAHRPRLLILDEPSSGLDPVVRRDILEAIISSISKAGCTVVFSSHLLDEVERVSDYVAMIRSGKILECDTLERIKDAYSFVTLSFEETQSHPPGYPPAIHWQGGGREWTALCRDLPPDFTADITMIGGRVVERSKPSLDEIFIAHSVPAEARSSPAGNCR